jgi:hypothetical protein
VLRAGLREWRSGGSRSDDLQLSTLLGLPADFFQAAFTREILFIHFA